MRSRFDEQLEKLNDEMTEMGSMCQEVIATAVTCLLEDDDSLLSRVTELDNQIDQKERDIEALCMKLLLQQQPVARDLRVISAALKMVSDMERIGDQASDIGEITKYIKDNDTKSKLHIRDMAKATIHMVNASIDSFVRKDQAVARGVIDYDDVVDDLFDRVKSELIQLIGEDSSNGEFCIDLLMIAKYLERIGDHAVNIAEWVLYMT